MKVLQINTSCGTGSVGRITADLHTILKEQGHQSKIAYGRRRAYNVPEEDTIKIGNDWDVNVHGLMTRITDKTGFYSKTVTEKFIKKVVAYDPDVIHLHGIHGYYIHIGVLFNYLAKADKPVIWTLHDCWAFTGHCAHFDFIGCDKWKTGCMRCPQKNTYPASVILDNSKMNYLKKSALFTSVKDLTLISPSKWLADLAGQSFLSKHPIQVINNGINLNFFKPTENNFKEKYRIEDKIMVLGVASSWTPRKGLASFIALSEMLDVRYKIVLVGLSKKQLKDLPGNIIGLSRTNNTAELAQVYTAADVFVNPSVEETFGLVTAEAMACGTPVIVYNSTASPELVADTGCPCVESGNTERLKDAVMRVCKHGKGIYSEGCVNSVAENYNMVTQSNKYIDCYKSVANNDRKFWKFYYE